MYIGNTPAENYASFLTETFTVSATANYTLSHAVTNENEIRLVINGVVQQPGSGKAYTASGTTLTLTSATVSGDVMYAVYLGRALQTVNPPNASVGTAQLADSSVTSAKLGTKNTPAFLARLTSDQSVSNGTSTKVLLDSTVYDTANAFSSNKFTVPSGQDGTYLLYFSVDINAAAVSVVQYVQANIRKNGSNITNPSGLDFRNNYGAYANQITCSIAIPLVATDYIELYMDQAQTSGTPTVKGSSTSRTYLGGYKLII